MRTIKPLKYRMEKEFCPKISIVIPVYNTGNYLSECLESVINQSYRNLEIICVDDGSTDISPSILKYYEMKDNRVRCFRQENKGQSSARNLALDVATGEYVMFLDSDDFLIKNAVFQCIETAYLHKCVSAVIFNMEMFFPDGNHYTCLSGPLFNNRFPMLSSTKTEISVNFTNAATLFVKTELLDKHNVRFPEGMIYEDWVFMVRLMSSENFTFFWLNSPLYWYRRGFAKSTTSRIDNRCLDLFRAYKESEAVLKNSTNDRRQLYINDVKILNEGIGFLLENIFNSNDDGITRKFTEELRDIIWSFPETYFMMLTSYLTEERSFAAIYFRNRIHAETTSSDLHSLISKLKKELKKRRRNWAIKNKLRMLKSALRVNAKKMLRMFFPAYRVSSSVREEVEGMMNTVNEAQRMLQSIDKRLTNLESEKKYYE